MKTLIRKLYEALRGTRENGSLAGIQALLRGEIRPDTGDLAGRIPGWLASPSWTIRNGAVKLIARFRLEGLYGELDRVVRDRAEAGIVRRNAAQALGAIRAARPAALEALIAALEDPYWEVRAQAAMALAAIVAAGRGSEDAVDPEGIARIEGVLLAVLRRGRRGERSFEVRAAIARALGAAGGADESFAAIESLAADPSWIVRHQAAVALAEVAARDPRRRERVAAILDRMDLSSEGTLSYSLLQEEIERLRRAAADGVRLRHLPFDDLYLRIEIGWCANGDRGRGGR
ncbi:MAG: HEAT repeat domain-containing protein [Planctomycetes bacterium]|nr:HEAT repeat domain-containing protein [Planctomycetota bacterium]